MNKTWFHIDKEYSVGEVQEKFSALYPYLRINFFKNKGNSITDQSVIFCADVKMKEINPDLGKGELELTDLTTVSELEKKLYDLFGLSAQVSRKSGNLWLETTMTDHWTLKEQNDHGKEISPDHRQNQIPVPFREVPYGC